VEGTDRAIPEIDPGNAEATSTSAAISFMGFTILIVRRRGVILCKDQGRDCRFSDPKKLDLGHPAKQAVEELGAGVKLR
jgi:hypothetical protein